MTTRPTSRLKDSKKDTPSAVGGLKFKLDSPKNEILTQPPSNREVEIEYSAPTRLPKTTQAKPAAGKRPSKRANPPAGQCGLGIAARRLCRNIPRGNDLPGQGDCTGRADYQAPAETSGSGRIPNEIVAQSYQQPQPTPWKSAPATAVASSQRTAPPVALQGFCPVELSRVGNWVQGDPRWTVIHQGRTYRLSGNEQRKQFLANPDRFTPANGGNDLVISIDQRRTVPGDLNYCAALQWGESTCSAVPPRKRNSKRTRNDFSARIKESEPRGSSPRLESSNEIAILRAEGDEPLGSFHSFTTSPRRGFPKASASPGCRLRGGFPS